MFFNIAHSWCYTFWNLVFFSIIVSNRVFSLPYIQLFLSMSLANADHFTVSILFLFQNITWLNHTAQSLLELSSFT
jgi:hypothetical protein